MFNLSAKRALIFSVLPIGLLACGWSGTAVAGPRNVGAAGVHDIVAGNWTAAKEDFNEDYSKYPEHPVAVFNMGATYDHDGNVDKAGSMFSEAAISGRGFRPDFTLEPGIAGVTVAEQSCFRLHKDNRLDPNCGDQVALEMPPAPPPASIAEATPEPAPAVEAEATTISPKQDRN